MNAPNEPLVNPLLDFSGLPRFGEISRPALESFIAFRGRAAQIDAVFRHNGMSAS